MGAPLNPVPGVVRCVIEGFVDTSAADTLWANVLHFQYAGPSPSQSQLSTMNGVIENAWSTQVASLCPSPTSLQAITTTDLASTSGAQAESLVLVPGTRGDDSIPANAAVLISYPSQIRYKGGHPRQYLYVLGNADLLGATNWSTAATAEVQAHWRTFLGTVVGTSVGGTTLSGFCSVRYKGKFLPNGGPPHFYLTNPIVNPIALTQVTARQQIASQRGRIERRKA